MDLFTSEPSAPLAELLRPTSLDEVVGQKHLVGEGKPLRMAYKAGVLHSFILWGPPGVGKTTLARLTAKTLNYEFIALSAVMAGVKEIREAVERAQSLLALRQKSTVLFMDEIHRLNKGQQDALLPYVENGTLRLIGATTESPGHSVVGALLSRAQVYVLKPLSVSDLSSLYARATPHLNNVTFDEESISLLANAADGDARRFLNLLEQLATAAQSESVTVVKKQFLSESMGLMFRRFDKGGEQTYDQVSAFQKSIRGSSPNAALYWLARMLDGGADPLYLARRLIVIASEDVGNADPRALGLAIDAAEAYARLGSPEGDRALAQAAVYLALAPKSNAVYSAWNEAQAFVKSNPTHEVPMHLRNAPTALAKALGHKKGYRYAHDEPNGYAAGESYFPDAIPDQDWYHPVDRGMEIRMGEKLRHLKDLDTASSSKRRP